MKMLKRINSSIIVSEKERKIDTTYLQELAKKYFPRGMSSDARDEIVDEIIFRISDLEFKDEYSDTEGRRIEEYYFAACLAYIREKSFLKFLDEEDDGEIFDYCGCEIPNAEYIYVYTEKGREVATQYVSHLEAKKKEILDAKIDTCDNTYLPSIEDILDDAIDVGFDEEDESINGWGVTDNYDADYPICLTFKKDVIRLVA